MATDPMRLGVTLLLISRPRPILNLLVYWLGVMAVGVTSGVVVLTMMRDFAPALLRNFSSFAANPAVRHTQLVAGLLALLLATLITTGLPARQRFGCRCRCPSRCPCRSVSLAIRLRCCCSQPRRSGFRNGNGSAAQREC